MRDLLIALILLLMHATLDAAEIEPANVSKLPRSGVAPPGADLAKSSHARPISFLPSTGGGPALSLRRDMLGTGYEAVARLDAWAGLNDQQLTRIREIYFRYLADSCDARTRLNESASPEKSRNASGNMYQSMQEEIIQHTQEFYQNREQALTDLAQRAQKDIEAVLTTGQMESFKDHLLRGRMDEAMFPSMIDDVQFQSLREAMPGMFELEEWTQAQINIMQAKAVEMRTNVQKEMILIDRKEHGGGNYFGVYQQGGKYTDARRILLPCKPWLSLTPKQWLEADVLSARLKVALKSTGYSTQGWRDFAAHFAAGLRAIIPPARLSRVCGHMQAGAVHKLLDELRSHRLTPTDDQIQKLETRAAELVGDPSLIPGDMGTLNQRLGDELDGMLTIDQKMEYLPESSARFTLLRNTWGEDQRKQIWEIRRKILSDGTPRRLYQPTLELRMLPVLTGEQRGQLSRVLETHAYTFLMGLYEPAKLNDDQKHAIGQMCRDWSMDLETAYRVPTTVCAGDQPFDFHADIVPQMFAMVRTLLTPEQKELMKKNPSRSSISLRMPEMP